MFLTGAGVLLTVVFTLLDPAGSDALSGIALLLFWGAHIFSALLILNVAQVGLQTRTRFSRLSPWTQIVLSGVVGAMLFAPLAGALDVVFGIAAATDDTSETLAARLWSEFTGLVGPVVLVWLGLNASRLVQITSEARDITETEPNNDILSRLPKSLGQDIVAMSAELHYLRVYTVLGETLILFPFGQAVQEMGETGAQIHRSHWVAFSHIQSIERQGRGGLCTLKTGVSLPISNRRRKAVEEAFQQAS